MPSSIIPSAAFLTLVLAAGQRALALNDWSIPCTQGKCGWDVPADTGTSGSVTIWGSVSAISDITPAAGWQIMTKCNPTSSQQDIQLICMGNNPRCDHLFQGNGAVDTIVRLPENCGPNPFARVAQHQVSQSNLGTRDNGSATSVHQLKLDTDFAAAGTSQGEVYFSVQGQNWRDNSNTVNRRRHRRLRSFARSQNHIYRQVDTNSTTDGNSTFGGNSTSGGNSTTGGNSTSNGNSTAGIQDGLSVGSFNKSLSAKPAPVNFSGQKNLFSDGSGSIDIATNLQASVTFNVVAAGSLAPLKITKFGITFGLDGNADAKLSVSGDISGQISSGNITLFQVGIPGLFIPEVLEIGPEFALLGRIDANFGLKNVNAVVEVSYDLGGADFVFPPQDGSNTGGIAASSKQVTFSADPGAAGATLGAVAHLIPEVSLGVKALGGAASASVFLDFDASLALQGNISGANPQPCLAGKADINVDVGAEGSFFGLFDASAGKSLFEKDFPLFRQCFSGNSNSNSTNSTSQSSASDATSTNSAPPTSATNASSTDPASQTTTSTATNASSTDSVSQTTTTDASSTNPASQITTATDASSTNPATQTTVTDASSTDPASQTSATDASSTDTTSQAISTATNARRHDNAPRAVRYSARFGRSFLNSF